MFYHTRVKRALILFAILMMLIGTLSACRKVSPAPQDSSTVSKESYFADEKGKLIEFGTGGAVELEPGFLTSEANIQIKY